MYVDFLAETFGEVLGGILYIGTIAVSVALVPLIALVATKITMKLVSRGVGK